MEFLMRRLRSIWRTLLGRPQATEEDDASADLTGGMAYRLADSLTMVARSLPGLIPQSLREDMNTAHFDPVIAPLLNLYFHTVSFHDAVLLLVRKEHGLNAMVLVRPQAEGLVTLLYLLEAGPDLAQVGHRVEHYMDWIRVKQWMNHERSQGFDLLQGVPSHPAYVEEIRAGYEAVAQKYDGREPELRKLRHSASFVPNKSRVKVAEKAGFKDLYQHIIVEGSASIHVADYGDRMTPSPVEDFVGFRFKIRSEKDTTWPLTLSNLLLMHSVVAFAEFLGVDHVIRPVLLGLLEEGEAEP